MHRKIGEQTKGRTQYSSRSHVAGLQEAKQSVGNYVLEYLGNFRILG